MTAACDQQRENEESAHVFLSSSKSGCSASHRRTYFRHRHRLHLRDVFRIHSGRTAEPRLGRGAEPIGQLRIQAGQRTLPRQEVRCASALQGGFRRLLTWVRIHRHGRVVDEHRRRADVRLGEVDRVVDDRRQLKVVADPAPAPPHRRLVAVKESHPADVVLLQMGRRHDEHVAFPRAGRESAPGVNRVLRRMRTSVHPDRDLLLLLVRVRVPGDHFLRRLIDLGPHAHPREAAFEAVVERVRPTDPFGDVEVVWRPAVAAPAAVRADRHAGACRRSCRCRPDCAAASATCR